MTQQTIKYRKLIYVALIVVLLYPLYLLGNPSQRGEEGMSEGGLLAKKRMENNLSEAKLGEIDPAGSAMKLATFGMRGVAVSLLWNRSLEYEKRSDWDNVVATANQIITLEPHFITIWDFVGWKLAYNASAQFDDYRERYRWVIRGFEFVQRGTTHNKTAPKLYVRAGWTMSQKIGIADEKKQYRRLLREDDEFAARQSEQEIFVSNRDNWLLGHAFYKRAEDLYENHNGDIGKETRLLFFGRAPLNRIRYAEWMEIDGCGLNKENAPIFDEENCATAWRLAEEDWKKYSDKVVSTTIEDKENPGKYRETSLNVQKITSAQINERKDWLASKLPEGVTLETIVWDRWNNVLDDKQRASMYELVLHPFDEKDYNLGDQGFGARVVRKYLDGEYGPQAGWENWKTTLLEKRYEYVDESLRDLAKLPRLLVADADTKDYGTAYSNLNDWSSRAAALLRPTPEVVAEETVEDARAEAQDKVLEIADLQKEESFSRMFRDIMGADYHEREVAFEQTPEAREARRQRQLVRDKYQSAQPEESNKAFLACFDAWVALLNREDFADLRYMPQMKTELLGEFEKYMIVLDALETVFPQTDSIQAISELDDSAVERLRGNATAVAFIEQELADGKAQEACEHAEHLLKTWTYFNEPDTPYELAPSKKITDAVFDVAKLYARTWEARSADELKLARQSGRFAEYPSKDYIEFVLQKSDENYLAIQKLQNERIADVDKTFENLEKEIALWQKVVERAPILKLDESSEFYAEIHNTVQEYQTELKKREQELPEDFPLKAFENAPTPQI